MLLPAAGNICREDAAAAAYNTQEYPESPAPARARKFSKVLNFKFGLIARLGANFAVNEPQKVGPAVNCTGCT